MKKILVCEDEDVIRDFVVINLKRAGYDVVDVNFSDALAPHECKFGWSTNRYAPITTVRPVNPHHDSING